MFFEKNVGWGVCSPYLRHWEILRDGGRRVESPLTHNHPTALDGHHRTQWCSSSCSWAMSCPRRSPSGAGCKPSGHRHQAHSQLQHTARQVSAPSGRGRPRSGSKSPGPHPPGKLRCLTGQVSRLIPHLRTRRSSHQLIKVLSWQRRVPGSCRFSGRPVPPLTWLLHTQQGDVVVQVGHGPPAARSLKPARSCGTRPVGARELPAAALLVAAVERVGKGESRESGLHVWATCEPGITLLLTTPRTCFLGGLPGACSNFASVISPGPSGTTVPLGTTG